MSASLSTDQRVFLTIWLPAWALVLLSGCTRSEQETRPVSATRYDVGGAGAYVREFWLKDGTHCVLVREAGITCDWQGEKEASRD